MYQRARTVGYRSLSGGALRTRSSRDILKERRRKGHSIARPDRPYEIPSYYSEKDRRRGKKHPGHVLREELAYGPGRLGGHRRGETARERSEYERAIAEPVEEFLHDVRGPRHTKRWLGDFSDPAALRRQRRARERQADLAEATAAQPRQRRIEGPAVPETIEAAPPVRGKKVEWTSTGERQYYTHLRNLPLQFSRPVNTNNAYPL